MALNYINIDQDLMTTIQNKVNERLQASLSESQIRYCFHSLLSTGKYWGNFADSAIEEFGLEEVINDLSKRCESLLNL